MGFGTLFIGYFFLVNITYFAYTDIIAAMLMLMGLYKLSYLNRPMKTAMVFSVLFALFSLSELVITLITMLFPGIMPEIILTSVSIPRYILLFALTITITMGIYEVSSEVGADALAARAKRTIPLSFIYILLAVFDIPGLAALFGVASGYIFLVLILSLLIILALNLITIYRAYMQICMPDEVIKPDKESKFAFVNKFREYEASRAREYAEYKLEKKKKKAEKKAEKNKK